MKKVIWVLSLILVIGLFAGCGASSESGETTLVGKWESEQDKTIIEYTADGKYKGLNDLDYNYEIVEGKQIKITNPEYTDGSDSIIMDFTLEGDVLKTVYNDYEVVWKRVK